MSIKESADISRREEVLTAVVSVMRNKGVMQARLQDIGEELGISYTTLYHYFPGRDRLVAEVLQWTIDKRQACLSAATGDSALERLLDFVWRDLAEAPELKVAMPFLGGFPADIRRRITRRRQGLLDEIIALVQLGVDEGSIRPCHPETNGEVILNYLERFVLFDEWLATAAKTKSQTRVTQEVMDILRHGILTPGQSIEPSYRLAAGTDLVGVPEGISPDFDRYEEIMRAATRAFNQEGAGASIPRMAKQLGVSKTVVYHYAMDKRDLLSQCYLRGVRILERSHQIAMDFGTSAVDEIFIHRQNLFQFHASEAGPFTLLNALGYLHPQQRRVLNMRNAAVRAVSEDRMRRAIAAGAVRPGIDPQIAQALFGQVLYGLPSWYRDDFPLSVMEVAQESGMLLFRGLEP